MKVFAATVVGSFVGTFTALLVVSAFAAMILNEIFNGITCDINTHYNTINKKYEYYRELNNSEERKRAIENDDNYIDYYYDNYEDDENNSSNYNSDDYDDYYCDYISEDDSEYYSDDY